MLNVFFIIIIIYHMHVQIKIITTVNKVKHFLLLLFLRNDKFYLPAAMILILFFMNSQMENTLF